MKTLLPTLIPLLLLVASNETQRLHCRGVGFGWRRAGGLSASVGAYSSNPYPWPLAVIEWTHSDKILVLGST
jgi:hypothetical protein